MKQTQQQVIDSFVRVQAFLDTHPIVGPLSLAGARYTLDDAVRRLREHAPAQMAGRVLVSREVRSQRRMIRQLLDRHIRPIVAIARARVEPGSEVQLPSSLRMPRAKMGVTRILLACNGIIEAVRPFEATFVENGLPADFLARFSSARDALADAFGDRANQVGVHVGASTGLAVELRRGRAAVERIDAVVRATFDDEPTLAAWRSARRVHLLRTGGGGGVEQESEPEEMRQAA